MGVEKGSNQGLAIKLAIASMLAAVSIFVALLVFFIYLGAGETRERLDERSMAAAQVVSTNAYWITELADQTLRRVDAALGPAMTGSDASIESVLDGLPDAADTYVIDAAANTLFATVPGASRVSVADREYFTALKAGAKFYMSPLLVSRTTKQPIFVFSKRVERNGAFAGAIMISFPESILTEILDTLDLPEGSSVSLIRDDGQLMARSPPSDTGFDLSKHVLFTQYLPGSDLGTYASAASPLDGIARIVSYRRVEGRPLVALAAIASNPSWQSFHSAILSVLLIVSPVLICLGLACVWIVKLLRRGAERNRLLEESVDLNTMLLREIHHRVKNNLASIQALVRMQDIPQEAKRDLEGRFAAMTAMHEHIYSQDRYENIDAAEFIPAIISKALETYGSTAGVKYDVDAIPVDRDHATPLALLLTELVANSCKYAFADGRTGEIRVALKREESGVSRLIFRDNGKGMETEPGPRSMGMRIIRGAVAQMDGTCRFTSDNGLVFTADMALSRHQNAEPAGQHELA